MVGRPHGPFRGLRSWFTPPAVAGLVVLVVAAACLSAGVLALAATGPTGALTAGQAAAAPDDPVHVAGTVERVWVDGGRTTTHLALRGAPGLDVQVAGRQAGPFSPGDFVDIEGQKQGDELLVHAVGTAQDPVDRAAPWLAVAAVLLAGLAAFTLPATVHRAGARWPGVLARAMARLPGRREAAPQKPAPPAE